MWIFERIATFVPSVVSARGMAVALAFGALSQGCVQAQAPPPAKAGADNSGAGFSIESEMLTYRALQSNSEAIACDIAAYLNGTNADFKSHPGGAVCDVKTGVNKATVVLLPFASSEFADFQIWRADMATMERLQNKADGLGCSTKPGGSKGATTAASAASSALSLTPAGPALSVAQGVLSMLAKQEDRTPVGGTVHDQAFMDGVGRELQELSMPVLMPSAYTPYSLTALKEADSPFLSSLARTLSARGCLAGLAAKEKGNTQSTDDADTYIVQRIISDIDAYLNTLSESGAAAPNGSKTPPAKSAAAPPPGAKYSIIRKALKSQLYRLRRLTSPLYCWRMAWQPSLASIRIPALYLLKIRQRCTSSWLPLWNPEARLPGTATFSAPRFLTAAVL